jgi:invasion protein IalB
MQDDRAIQDEYDDKDPSDRRPLLWVLVLALIIAALAAIGILWKGQALAPALAWARTALNAKSAGPTAAGQATVADPGQRIGAWTANCDAPAVPCALVQTVQAGGEARLGATWRIEAAADGNLHSAWSLPTGVLVRPGMTLGFDGKPPTAVPYESCAADLCEVRAKLTANFVQTMRAAQAGVVTVMLRQGGAAIFTFSHDGLVEGLDLLASKASARQGD